MGGEKLSQTKLPTVTLLTSSPLTFNVTASPAKHCCIEMSSLTPKIAFTRPISFAGTTTTRSPNFTEPDSILPANEIAEDDCDDLYTSEIENRSGLSKARSDGFSRFMQSIRLKPKVDDESYLKKVR